MRQRKMRRQLNKLRKGHSTKAERRFAERLKAMHIPFRTKVLIKNREIDFVIGRYVIDIDGHEQDGDKNQMLVQEGYVPLHLNNREVTTTNLSYLK
jgi:very-short-patch-repair endonuclease